MERRDVIPTDGELKAVKAALQFRPNPNRARRDELLGFSELPVRGSVEAFCEIDARTLRGLVDEGFLDPERRHHDSPTAREFVSFIERWPQCSAHGFVDRPECDDGRVVIEGIECDLDRVPSIAREALREEFAWFCGDAAEYFDEADYLYAWWG
jgi:hypothetical protein